MAASRAHSSRPARPRPGRWAWRNASLAAIFAVLGPAAHAGLVPGGGSPASDCYVEAEVAGIENGTGAVKRNRKVTCVDGDPCDTPRGR
jgi:hypothetical protein